MRLEKSGSNLSVVWLDNGMLYPALAFIYSTLIAVRDRNRKIWVTKEYYSVTTSRNKNQFLKHFTKPYGEEEIEQEALEEKAQALFA